MNIRSLTAAMAVLTLAAVGVLSGCSTNPTTSPFAALHDRGPAATPGDSVPPPPGDSVPPPPPPPPPPIVPVAFAGADSAIAGGTGHLRWAIGNESNASFTVHYTLQCGQNWPGFPLNGSINIAASTAVPLTIPVAVPSNAATGEVQFTMTVTRPNGIPPTSADGSLLVVSNNPPPPPPPPGVQALVYLGADSARAGGSVTQHWSLGNESSSTYSMPWTLESWPAWPSLPQSGTLLLLPGEVKELTTVAAIPDTAATGYRWLRLTVTRPNGLGDAGANGYFYLAP
jgi:hypothetical protein